MTYLSRYGLCLALAACASDGITTTEADASLAQERVGRDEIPVGLYHLPNLVDAVSLELRQDNTFRWSLAGCDTFGGGDGVVELESNGQLLLLPKLGKTGFRWPGEVAVAEIAQLRIEITQGKLVERPSNTAAGSTWLPGGVCAICGGDPSQLGPRGTERCDAPFFLDAG